MTHQSRVALVTGAASGIGAAIAARLVREGLDVLATDRRSDVAGAAERIGARAMQLDITDDASVSGAIGALDRLDVLVNCAGIVDETPTAALTIERYRRVLDVDLDGAVRMVLAVQHLLRRSEAGRVLNVVSIQGYRGAADSLAYGAAKGGLLNLTRGLAVDLAADGVLVNALAPGFIDTPMATLADGRSEYETDWFRDVYLKHGRIPLRRPGRPEEVAEAALFFVSTANTYVTGQFLAVDGGLTAGF